MKLSESYGVKGFMIDSNDKLESTLDEAFAHKGPALIEIRISLLNQYFQWFQVDNQTTKWRALNNEKNN